MIALRSGMLALAGLAGLTGVAQAADVTLTIHHFLGPKAPAQTAFLEPWAERVEAASDGRIEIEIFPSMALGGKPPELYSQVRDGVADMVWTVLGYTPGVFPRAEVFELPTVHEGSAEQTTQAIQQAYDLVAEDFKDVHPLLIHAHAGQALFMVDKEVRELADLQGLKLRIPSRSGAMLIEAWGAEPVGMPVPELPQALSKNAVDGAMIPFEVSLPLKVHEMTSSVTVGHDGRRFGTSVFLFLMNKDSYAGLPDDLKAVIDAHSGSAIAAEIGQVWDGIEVPGQNAMTEAGHAIIELGADAQAAFDERAREVEGVWLEEVSANGIDGETLLEEAKAAIAAHATR